MSRKSNAVESGPPEFATAIAKVKERAETNSCISSTYAGLPSGWRAGALEQLNELVERYRRDESHERATTGYTGEGPKMDGVGLGRRYVLIEGTWGRQQNERDDVGRRHTRKRYKGTTVCSGTATALGGRRTQGTSTVVELGLARARTRPCFQENAFCGRVRVWLLSL